MGNFSKSQDEKKEARAWNCTVKETLAKFFLDLAKLVFAAIVLGGFVPIFTDKNIEINWVVIGCGTFISTCFSVLGYKILKNK